MRWRRLPPRRPARSGVSVLQSRARLNRRHAASHEGLARVWRDWGFPLLGLGDAYRAILFAPAFAVGREHARDGAACDGPAQEARAAYRLALLLRSRRRIRLQQPVLSLVRRRDAPQAHRGMPVALRARSGAPAAHNNLALTYAAIGHLDLARQEFDKPAARPTPPTTWASSTWLSRITLAAEEFEAARLMTPISSMRRGAPATRASGAERTQRRRRTVSHVELVEAPRNRCFIRRRRSHLPKRD